MKRFRDAGLALTIAVVLASAAAVAWGASPPGDPAAEAQVIVHVG